MNRVDGEWMVTADWDPAVYDLIAQADVANGRYATTPGIAAAVLWMKQRLFAAGLPTGWSDTDVGTLSQYGQQQVWNRGAAVGGNLWRVSGDIHDDYNRMAGIGFGQNGRERYAGPGHWNDRDMLEIGNGRMTLDEYRTHMTLWCILAASLIAGNDLVSMTEDTLALFRVSQNNGLEVWAKPLSDGSYAVGLFNRTSSDDSITVSFTDIGGGDTALVRDLWSHQDLGPLQGSFSAGVPSHGAVLVRISSEDE